MTMLSYDPPAAMDAQATSAMPGMTPASPLRSLKPVRRTSQSSRASEPSAQPQSQQPHHHIWLVTGPAGCGKSTVAEHLAEALDMPYIEGDTYHTAANVEKMRTGTPLTDADRWDWLTALREESLHRINGGSNGVVLTCSALKRKYRDVIRVAGYFDHRLLIHFIYLDAPEEVLLQRVTQRQGHYMGANMVHSQFACLERPTKDETDVITVDVTRTLEEVEADTLARALEYMKSDSA